MAGMSLIISNAAKKSHKTKTEKKKSLEYNNYKDVCHNIGRNYFDGMADREIVLQ